MMSKTGFTLSEVLITLAIIGIVAAMTLPIIIKKYRHKVLEVQFKKTYTVLSQAAYAIPAELSTCTYTEKAEITELLFARMNALESGTTESLNYDGFKTYTKEEGSSGIHPNCFDDKSNTHLKWAVTPDGTVIATCVNASYGTMISIDINGSKKPPNAFGHDLFFFRIKPSDCQLVPMTGQWRTCTEGETDCKNVGISSYDGYGWKWTTSYCTKDSASGENGFSCTPYAIKNICPDDSSKGYFECLP